MPDGDFDSSYVPSVRMAIGLVPNYNPTLCARNLTL